MNTSSQEKTTKAFFQLLRIAIGNENAFSYYLNDDEWNWIWDMAHRQALTGIVFDGICLLPQKQRPPRYWSHRNSKKRAFVLPYSKDKAMPYGILIPCTVCRET